MLLLRLLFIGVFLLLINASQTTSQVNVNGYISAGYPVSATEEYHSIYQDWKFNMGAGVVMEYHPLSSIIIAPSFSFQYVFFDEYHPGFIGSAYPVNSQGEGSQIYQVGTEFVAHKSREKLFDPQFILGGGYQWIDYGTRTTTWKDLDGSTSKEVYAPEILNGWYLTIGVGGTFRISPVLFLNTTAKFVNSINYWHSVDSNDLLVSASINYRFI